MILIDSSIWIDHLHHSEPEMQRLLEDGEALLHPYVMQEICLGSLRNRDQVTGMLKLLPEARVVSADEVLVLIEGQRLYSTGIGLTDVHLLASALIDDETLLWTRDRRLEAAARRLAVSAT